MTRVALIAAVVLLGSCSREDPRARFAMEHGFIDCVLNRDIVTAAAETANSILGRDAGIRFVPSWQPGSASGQDDVPVYHLVQESLPTASFCFVPRGCRCVIVNGDELDLCVAMFGGAATRAVSLDPRDLLAIVLLHEAGHLHYRDESEFIQGVRLKEDDLTRDLNETKSTELRADLFAVDKMRAAAKDFQNPTRFSSSVKVQLALTTASFNLTGIQVLDHFGESQTDPRKIFWDRGYTHPNFQLRILIMLDAMNSTPSSRDLLRSFLAARESAASRASLGNWTFR